MSDADQIILQQISLVITEDVGPGDLTTLACVDPGPCRAEITAKSDGILAGLPVAEAVFLKLDNDLKFSSKIKDGDSFNRGDVIAEIKGNSHAILTGERAALNYLGHLSGIATLTARFAETVKGTKAIILDTRKTIPGLRLLEKYAVTCGGGQNHRYGLFDMALIKDNHIAACGSVGKAVDQIKKFIAGNEYRNIFMIPAEEIEIEVEVTDIEQLKEAVAGGITRIMLDNRSPEELAGMVKAARKLADNLKLEASGNVNLETVRKIAETGVDFISIGALTHSAPASDFSLKITK